MLVHILLSQAKFLSHSFKWQRCTLFQTFAWQCPQLLQNVTSRSSHCISVNLLSPASHRHAYKYQYHSLVTLQIIRFKPINQQLQLFLLTVM